MKNLSQLFFLTVLFAGLVSCSDDSIDAYDKSLPSEINEIPSTGYYDYPFEYYTESQDTSSARIGGQIINQGTIYASGSGTLREKYLELPYGHVLTGIGIRVHNDNVVRMELESSYLYSDGTLGTRMKHCDPESASDPDIDCYGTLERWVAAPDGAAIVGVAVRANQDNCATLKAHYKSFNSSARFNTSSSYSTVYDGTSTPELTVYNSQAGFGYDRSVVIGLGLRVNQDNFVTLEALYGQLQ